MLKKLKWAFLYVFFIVFVLFTSITFVGFTYYTIEKINMKINAYWWIAIMKNGSLDMFETFMYYHQQILFFVFYCISLFIYSLIVYVYRKKSFWIFVGVFLIFMLACFLGELSMVNDLQSINIKTEEQLIAIKWANTINEIVWLFRWFLYFSLLHYLILTIGSFRKRDFKRIMPKNSFIENN